MAVSPEWVEYLEAGLSKGMEPVRQNCLALDSATTRVSCLSKGTSSPARQRQEPDRLLEHCPATALEIHNAAEIMEEGAADYADT